MKKLVACFKHCIESSKAGMDSAFTRSREEKGKEKAIKKLVKKRQLVDNYRMDSSNILVTYGQVRYFFL